MKLVIERDPHPESPREWDNLGTIVCWHVRYRLGDVQPKMSPDEWLAEVPADSVILPLYLYDHGGITMRTAPFLCPWDSGQVGWIYVTAEKIKAAYGWKRLTDVRRKKVGAALRSEVETYSTYLEGEVYGFNVVGKSGESIDSCWGFFGCNPEVNGMAAHLERPLTDYEIEYR